MKYELYWVRIIQYNLFAQLTLLSDTFFFGGTCKCNLSAPVGTLCMAKCFCCLYFGMFGSIERTVEL